MNSRERILLVDDEPKMHALLRVCLAPLGYDIESAANGPQALTMLKDSQYSVTTLDLMMPMMPGLDVLRDIRQQRLPTEVVVITAYGSLQSAIEALRLGAYDYVLKPFHPEAVRSAVRGAIDKQALTRKLAAIHDLSQEVTLARTVNQVAQAVGDVAHRVLAFEDCGLWLIDQPRGELHRIQVDTAAAGPPLDVLSIEGHGVIAAAARSGQLIYVPDTARDPRYRAGPLSIASELAVPLCIKDRVVGVLNMEHGEAQAFTPEAQQLAAILAAQAAVAIENARLHQAEQREIAERRRAMAELRAAKEAAEAANQAKSEFLARMSHEIRTPIHAIIGTTDLTLETPLTREQQDYLTLARTSAEALQNFIDDILDFSKIEAHRLELDSTDFDLRTVVEKSVGMMALRAHRKHLELICHVPPGVPTALVGDPGRLQQVLVNLVGNAVKFTEQGEVAVRVDLIRYDEHTAQLNFSVQDTGIGIARDKQAVMFDAFTQADGSASRRYGGTGLGLTIARQLVELMGGRIEVDSELGAGSRFSFTLRLTKQASLGQGVPEPCAPLHLSGAPALIAAGSPALRRVLRDMLSPLDIAITETDRAEALPGLIEQAAAANRPFRLIVLDSWLMSGKESIAQPLMQAIRDRLVLLLPGDNLGEDVAGCRTLGLAAHLVKPLKQHEVWDIVVTMLGLAVQPARATERVVARQLEGPRLNVLLAEDSVAGQLIGRQTLQKMGHTVQIAATGREVLRLLEAQSAQSTGGIDLVLMDVEMPDMDGLEAMQAIREAERETGQHLPILAMTAYAMKADLDRCLAAGADGYVAKPIAPDQLLSAIERFWATAHVLHPIATPVDLEVALDMVAGDRDLLLESVNLFLTQDLPRHWRELETGLAQQTPVAVKRAAHGLKGALDSFGGRPARDVALRLEAIGRSGDLTAAPAVAAELQEEVHRFATFYHRLAEAQP
ncbi:MAG: response regulator [Chloroflexi bacterium]|nr:response regulator [Chloroflexota bacterium]